MYTLKLGSVYLAPRKSIFVEESKDFEKLVSDSQASDCATACSNNSKREFVFTIHFAGGGSLRSAWALHAQVLAQLELACDQEILLERTVQDEDTLEYQVSGGILRMIDTINQFTCERVLTMELTLKLKAREGIQPLLVSVTLMTPTVTMVQSQSMTPLAVAVTFPTPGVLLEVFPDPLVITWTLVTPTDPPPPP